jgi:hypothetical protein
MSTKSLRVLGAVARPPANDDHDSENWHWKSDEEESSRRARKHETRSHEHDSEW